MRARRLLRPPSVGSAATFPRKREKESCSPPPVQRAILSRKREKESCSPPPAHRAILSRLRGRGTAEGGGGGSNKRELFALPAARVLSDALTRHQAAWPLTTSRPCGLRAVPQAKSLQWSDFRGEGLESYARMAGSVARSDSDVAELGGG